MQGDSDDTILALDIGTENVKAVIARQNESGGLDIIGIGKARQGASNMYAGAIADIPAVVDVCEKALSQAEKMSGTTSKLTVVGIAGNSSRATHLPCVIGARVATSRCQNKRWL